ncbi:hypothetical protein PHPALM_29474 [Phytophthora palmivora]|uniref:Uncharacterized protein n=1 Tax=Phytophthora palmivora TaxID=4796 RepID=A0A2P4X7I0_9STRA|nr:hypothetical protein PHPALM_29474 [Phytophthora palmivora]
MSNDAQYERIVRLIPVDELQSSYNSVVQDEISVVNRSVDDIVAAFSHVKEVRNAVTQLQTSKPQRSSSLLETMNSTLKLQQELEMRLQSVIQLMGTSQICMESLVEKNTECSDELKSNFSSLDECNSSDESEVEGRVIGESNSHGLFTNPDTMILDLEDDNNGGAETSRRLNLLPPVDTKEIRRIADCGSLNMETVVVKKSKELREMVENVDKISAPARYSRIRGIMLEITDVVNNKGKTGLREEDAVAIMRYVVEWPRDYIDQRSLLGIYQRFLEAMTTYEGQAVDIKEKSRLTVLIAKFSRDLEQLESREIVTKEVTVTSLAACNQKRNYPTHSAVNATACFESDNKKRSEPKQDKPNVTTSQGTTTTAKVPLEQSATTTMRPPVVRTVKPLPNKVKTPAYYTIMINNLKETPMQRRVQCIPHVLFQLKKAMLEDEVGQQKWQISDSVTEVLQWITKGFDVRHDFDGYHDFAIVLFSYAAQHPEAEALQRITDQFSVDIDKIRSAAPPRKTLISSAHGDETNSSDSHESSPAKSATMNVTTETSLKVDDSTDEMRKSKSESEHESESESESDYDDEKEAIGGSEAAWNLVMAAARESGL